MAARDEQLNPNSKETLRKLPEFVENARFSELHELASRILNSPEAEVRSRWNAAFFSLLAYHITREEASIEHLYHRIEELYPEKKPETANREYFHITAKIVAGIHGFDEGPERNRILKELEEQRDSRNINPLIQFVIEWGFFKEDPELLRKAVGHLVINKEQEADHYEYHRGNFFLALLEDRSADEELSRMIDTKDYPVQSYELGQNLIPLALERGAITKQEAEVLRNKLTGEG